MVRNNRRWYVGRVGVGPSAPKPFASDRPYVGGGGGCATEERSECVLGTDGPQQRYSCVGFLREVKHFEVDAEHMVAVAVDSLTTSTNEKHQFIVEIAK
jgi:hypothetical protein